MVSLDFRTVFIGHLFSTALCVVVLASLWLKNRERSEGLGFWVAHLSLQLVALLLILLRGSIPDMLSMAVANTLVLGGIVLLLVGLEQYLDVPGKHYHNLVYLVVFFAIHSYFSVGQPSLVARNINASVGLGFLSLQIVWLLMHRVAPDARSDARMTSAIFGAYVVLSTARIVVDLMVPASEDLFHSGLWDTLVFLGYQMLQIGLTLSLVLLVTRRLQTALECDIAQRVRAEQALRLSERKFSAAFESIPDAITLTSLADGLIIDVNQGFTRISEYTKAEAVGKTTGDLHLWAEASDRSHLVDALRETGGAIGFETTFRSKSGRLIEAVVSAALIVVAEEQFILTVIHDATESKAAQAAVLRSEAKFATAFHTSPDAVNINRLEDGVYLDVNEGFTKLTGYAPEEVIGVSSAEIHIWNDPADRQRLVAGLMADGVVNNLEAAFKRKNGSVTAALMSAQLIEIDGERCILSVTRDIGDRRTAELALRESEEKYRTLTESISDVVWTLDPTTLRFLYASPSVTRLRGFTPEEILAEPLDAALTPEGQTAVRGLNSQRLADFLSGKEPLGGPYTEEVEQPCKDGSTVWTEVVTSYYINPNTGAPEVRGVTREITDRKRAEQEILRLNDDLEQRVQERTEELTVANEELIEANIRLDEATQAKSDFLASMSHELRTPLNSIIGFSDILVRGMAGALQPEQQKQIGMIHASGKYLLELVNEVLDLSAIEAGRMRIARDSVDVARVVKTVVDSLEPLARHDGLELTWEVEPGVPALETDHTRLEQVLFNVVGNAIKFTESGSVRVDVREDNGDVVFAVSDTGRGIAAEDISRVFDEFYQVERHDVAKSQGTGLGLTVSRRLMEMLGGTIDVESAPGHGSVFSIRLPATASPGGNVEA